METEKRIYLINIFKTNLDYENCNNKEFIKECEETGKVYSDLNVFATDFNGGEINLLTDYIRIIEKHSIALLRSTKLTTLNNTKIYVGKNHIKIQEMAFNLDYIWTTDHPTNIKNIDKPFLYFNNNVIRCTNNLRSYLELDFAEITFEDIEEFHNSFYKKFEYRFKSGDKVLTRSDINQFWKYGIFSHYSDDNYPYNTNDNDYHKYCIPFKNNEHLLRENETSKYNN